MREIKFRGWNKEINDFIYGETILLQEYNNRWVMLVANEAGEEWIYIEEPQQYTGLEDKNGNEIYEGDIIKHNDKVYVVKYFDEFSRYACSTNKELNKMPMCVLHFGYCEVVGNIYENPDLLSKQI